MQNTITNGRGVSGMPVTTRPENVPMTNMSRRNSLEIGQELSHPPAAHLRNAGSLQRRSLQLPAASSTTNAPTLAAVASPQVPVSEPGEPEIPQKNTPQENPRLHYLKKEKKYVNQVAAIKGASIMVGDIALGTLTKAGVHGNSDVITLVGVALGIASLLLGLGVVGKWVKVTTNIKRETRNLESAPV